MSIRQQVLDEGKTVQIMIDGRFDFEDSQAFRDAYQGVSDKKGVEYCVDLSGANYMDSSALGMLLLLREHAKSQGGTVILEKPAEKIDKILRVANFEQLFTIN